MKYLEQILLMIAWLLCFGSVLFIPRKNRSKASFIFLVAQFPAWMFGVIVVEFGLLKYPYRLFHEANSTSFSFEFLILPILNVFFNLYYPQSGSKWKALGHYVAYCTIITVIEMNVERYTDLIEYTNWTGYWSWITLFMFFYMIRKIYVWFYQIRSQ